MPSFVSDDNSQVYSQSSGIVHLNHDAEYGLSSDKVNGQIAHHPKTQPSNESFDESSSHSTHTSGASGPKNRMNGDGSLPSTMNSSYFGDACNGEPIQTQNESPQKPIANGTSAVLPVRTSLARSSITNRGDGEGNRDNDVGQRNSTASTAAASIQPSPVEMYLHTVQRSDIRTVDNAFGGSSEAGASTQASSPPATIQGQTGTESSSKAQQSPHRYSSPPVYNPASPGASSSGAMPPPPGTGLKYRHTLEVPKVQPSRGSRDGVDGAFSSGRFSPTTAAAGVRRASLSLARRNTRSLHSDAPRDEIVPDEDALRWAEAYRQKRASKRRRKELEDDDRVLVGTKVDEKHANWVTAYNMLTGIRVSVSRTNAKIDRALTDADFEAKQKSTFDIAGNELIPSAKYDFKFKDYAPWVFRHLRALFRLDPADYLMSLTGKYILSELGSPGKSGSFFYFSRDYKYIIKTIHHGEHKFLRKILKDYYQHVIDNPNTLLSQFYGLHRVKIPYGKKIHFVVMNNIFPPHRDIHQTFDLKGSTIGREFKEEDLEANPRATLKDLNWMRRQRHLELGIQKKQLFLEQLQKDVRLMQRLQIMDYSLLVGIHDLQRGNEENLRDKTLRVFNPGGDTPEEFEPHSVLMRTPSKLENQRKARELRQMIKSERPVPMGETRSRMPDELEEGQNRQGLLFNQDDGGFRATHEDNTLADEIYYLGVIDCLTHYGIIKKLEHFWKGLSQDRHQISALPPQEYGERFINFISGITMSQEEAHRIAQEKDAAAAAEAAASEERQRVGSWNSARRHSSNAIPPAPTYKPPPPPAPHSPNPQSPEVEATMQKAEHEAWKTDVRGSKERDVADRTLRAIVSPPAGSNSQSVSSSAGERRELPLSSQTNILPVVEEAAEGVLTGERSRNSAISSAISEGESDFRPLTPAKDGEEMEAGFGNPMLRGSTPRSRGPPPPTPPKTGYNGHGDGTAGGLKPQSADSGYGFSGINGGINLKSASGSQKSLTSGRMKSQISRDSLDKALPPLPVAANGPTAGVS
ncbi:hypothetical protein V8F33_012580 [Rhypophila sp. PSN 637]